MTTEKKYRIDKFLRAAVQQGASDLHMKPGSPPKFRILGQLLPLTVNKNGVSQEIALSEEACTDYIYDTMDKATQERFSTEKEADYAIEIPDLGRFRVNASHTMGRPALVARVISSEPRTIEELGLPEVLNGIAQSKNGIILVTGATGSGKSATLAAMIDKINSTKHVNIITIEDPVETLHKDKRATVLQREVGIGKDTRDFATAMKAAMRQDPDIILVGEMRDAETVKTAIHAAETGHLVLSTLHTTSASDTLNRIIDFFPPHEHAQIRNSMKESLRAIISQRLIPTVDGKKRVPAMELLINEGNMPDAIGNGDTAEIYQLLKNDRNRGMQTFEASLVHLVREGLVSPTEALANTKNSHDLGVEFGRYNIDY